MLIIASIGISTTEEKIKKIILAGADVLRYNFSYHTIEKNIELINKTRAVIESLNSATKELIDFPLNKIRLGEFDMGLFSVKEGEELTLQSATYSPNCNEFIPVDAQRIGEKVKINQTINLGNGRMSAQITEVIDINTIKIQILNNGIIKSRQTFNNGIFIDEEKMFEIYTQILKNIMPLDIELLSISYISEDFSKKIKGYIISNYQKTRTKFIIRIEKEITEAELEKICQDPFYSIIMLDRGELGVNMPFEKNGIYQKKVSTIAKKMEKRLIISTQILPSILDNYIPTRSDISDLTNIILDGVYGIVLNKETDVGKRPAYAVYTAKRIINEVEKYLNNV